MAPLVNSIKLYILVQTLPENRKGVNTTLFYEASITLTLNQTKTLQEKKTTDQ